MSKVRIIDFLRDLSINNSKEWMDLNRTRYHEAKQIWLDEIALILAKISQHDSHFTHVAPKKTIMRINNNRQFHPNKPIYKDSFGCAPVQNMYQPSFYIHINPIDSFIGGGLHKPPSNIIKKMRSAIDYNGEELTKIVEDKKFQSFFGGWSKDPDMLKTSPRGYDIEHPYIELLRRKNFTAIRPLKIEEFIADDFVDLVEKTFVTLQPMNHYLLEATTFDD